MSAYELLIPDQCRVCQAELAQPEGSGRPRKYCSNACRQKAYRLRRRALARQMIQAGMMEYVKWRWVDYRSPFPSD